jgi:dTDP-4-amino-4,6-dideoxygalactose transaminase
MKVPFNDLYLHHRALQPDLDKAIQEIIDSSSFIRGSAVDRFEALFAEAIGVKHCVSCANGTDALFITMKGLGVGSGSEVITTAHSWISTSATITQAGGRVVFCDTDPETFTLSPSLIESKITENTCGIIPVHLYGQPADMDPILEIAERYGLWVIEDCAQAHLAQYSGRTAGTLGTAGTFSFYPGKNLGAMGDAGCVVTDDDELAQYITYYARHGGKGEHLIEGINSRMDGLQGAVLGIKLPHLPEWTAKRQLVAGKYTEWLAGIGDVIVPETAEGREHVFHLYVIRTEHRDALQAYLGSHGIQTIINYPKALSFVPAYEYLGHRPEDFPVAYSHQDRILSLPIFPEITDSQIEYVVACIQDFFRANPD